MPGPKSVIEQPFDLDSKDFSLTKNQIDNQYHDLLNVFSNEEGKLKIKFRIFFSNKIK